MNAHSVTARMWKLDLPGWVHCSHGAIMDKFHQDLTANVENALQAVLFFFGIQWGLP